MFFSAEIYDVTALENNKYKVKFVLIDDFNEPAYYTTAVVGMKEAQNGFRFWSIYSINYQDFDHTAYESDSVEDQLQGASDILDETPAVAE